MRKSRKSLQGRLILALNLLLLVFLFCFQGSFYSYAANVTDKEKATASELDKEELPWVSSDFTYGEIEKKIISKNSYYGITGLSASGKKKLQNNKYLVLPAYQEEGGEEKAVEGVGREAFQGLGLTGLKIQLAEGVKEYIIDDGAFSENQISELELPEGVKYIEAFAFKDNQIGSIELPKTLVKCGNESFAKNKIHSLTISPKVKLLQLDSFSFAYNEITELKLPYSVFKLLQNVFYKQNIGENKVQISTRNPKHLQASTYIAAKSDFHEIHLEAGSQALIPLNDLLQMAYAVKEDELTKGWEALQEAIEKAETLLQEEAPEENAIQAALESLEKSLVELEQNPYSVKALEEKLKEARLKKQERYEENSFRVFSEERNKAEELLQKIKRFSKDSSEEGRERRKEAEAEIQECLGKLEKAGLSLQENPDALYQQTDFLYEGTRILGFSESGKKKAEYNKDLVLPTVNPAGEAITEIGDKAFLYTGKDYILKTDIGYSPNGLRSVVIPDTVTKIGNNAFQNNALSHVQLPSHLEHIGDLAFNGNVLEEAILPDSLHSFGVGTFSLNRIRKVRFPEKLEVVPKGIFSRNIQLEEVELPKTVKIIEDSTFVGCPIQEITLPEGLEEIGSKAFLSHRIRNLWIPASVKKIGSQSFANNKKFRTLRQIFLEEGVEEIGNNTFKSALVEELYIPKSLKKLDTTAFNDNMNEEKELVTTKIYTASEEQSLAFQGRKLELLLLNEEDWEKGREEVKERLEKERDSKEKQEENKEEKKEDQGNKDKGKGEKQEAKQEGKKENQGTKQEEEQEGKKNEESPKTQEKNSQGSGGKAENSRSNQSIGSVRGYRRNSGAEQGKLKKGAVLGEQRYRSFSTKDNHIWQKNGESWYFIPLGEDALKDDWAKIDGRWYHFSKTGEMEKGWILDQGRYYYLAGDGGMLSWQWLLDQGKWYFLGEDGGMLANQWLFEGGKWYFLNTDGSYNTNSGA